MDKLNEYLQKLMSSCSDELRLEPDRNPYVVAQSGTSDVANVPLLGTQISTMVFPLIPPQVRAQLPLKSEVEFVLPHDLGNFNFTVQKSPAGFVVTIRPMLSDPGARPTPPRPRAVAAEPPKPQSVPQPTVNDTQTAEPELDLAPRPAPAEEYQLEVNAPAADHFGLVSSSIGSLSGLQQNVVTSSASGLVIEEPMSRENGRQNGGPEIELVSVNDPEYQTVFSDTADYEPPGARDDFDRADFMPLTDLMADQEITSSAPPDGHGVAPAPVSAVETTAFPQPQEPIVNTAPVPPITLQPPAQAAFVARPPDRKMAARMDAMFRKMAELGASDLHLSVSVGPMMRKDGRIQPLAAGMDAITAEVMRDMLVSIMPPKNQEEFRERHDTDFAYEIPGLARYRCNIFMDRKGMGGVFRIIPSKILTAEQLGLSQAIMNLCQLSKGLVVVTGPTGSGKSTTLCAMVDWINKNREDHIITIEDPIEFVHDNHRCLVNQREVHNHTDSFKDALRAALREDPDILLVGEMRDLETISIAIETAETGHLVFGTLHTTTAASTVDRIIDQFPADRQQQIRVMLSESLKGVIAQTLLPKKGGGRVAALEVLIVTPAISNLIREGKTFQIPSAMQTGKNHGMVMLNDALFEHVKNGTVEPRDAYVKAVDKTGFEQLLQRNGFKI